MRIEFRIRSRRIGVSRRLQVSAEKFRSSAAAFETSPKTRLTPDCTRPELSILTQICHFCCGFTALRVIVRYELRIVTYATD